MPKPILKRAASKAPGSPNRENMGTAVDPGLIQQIVQGVSDSIKLDPQQWFGPLQPLRPLAPDDVKGRTWDFPTGINLRQQPRDDGQSQLTFPMLRAFADACDVLRIVIERRKDQIEAIDFEIKPRKGKEKKPQSSIPSSSSQQQASSPGATTQGGDTGTQSVTAGEPPTGTPSKAAPPFAAPDTKPSVTPTSKPGDTSTGNNATPTDQQIDPMEAECELVRQFLQKPSTEHDWSGWLRAMLEDLFVLDAICIYPRQTVVGEMYSFDLIDAATIKRVIDDHGRTPLPPQPAYQQQLHGVPAVNYSADELIYSMRNPRTNKLYGQSPVEWIIITINTAIRKSLHQMQYYTEGNIPEALATAPEGWSVDQIKEFQTYWDGILAGDTALRRRMRMVPFDASKVKELKPVDLKDMFDEWIARVVCFAFGIAPSAFIKDQNRATAETIHEQSLEQGMVPLLNYIKRRMDYLIQRYMKKPDLEFHWVMDEDVDPQAQATVDELYVTMKAKTPDEIRLERFGLPPMSQEQKDAAWPTPPSPFGGSGLGPDGKPTGKGPDAKGGGFGSGANGPPNANGKQPPAGGAEDGLGSTKLKGTGGEAVNLKVVVAPTINTPDVYVTTPEVRVGAVEINADLRPEGSKTVSKTVRIDRLDGSGEGTVVSEGESDE